MYRQRNLKPKIRRLVKKKKFYQRKWFWLVVVILIFTSILFYYLIFSEKFQVKNVVIQGSENAQKTIIEEAVTRRLEKKLFSLGGFTLSTKSILLVNPHTLTAGILGKFPFIKEAVLKKNFPNGLTITVRERQAIAVFCQGGGIDGCFLMDDFGIIFERWQGFQNNLLFVRQEENDVLFEGKEVVEQHVVKALLSVVLNLQDTANVTAREAFISDELIIIQTSEGWELRLDASSDVSMQIAKMNTLLKNTISPEERKNLRYIYLQFKDRAYYR